MLLKHRSVRGSWLLGAVMLLPSLVYAECRVNSEFNAATHYLVNGIWRTPSPEVMFKLPGDSLGSGGAVVSDSLSYAGSSRTLANHVRFRLAVKNKSSTGVAMYMDSSSPLSCVNCASSVTIPFSKLGWTEGRASETRGSTPGNGQFNGGTQTLIYGNKNSDNMFNLQFNFANDEIYPAGAYEGAFLVRGIPQ